MPDERPRLLLTAGPTQEPIDAVRYLGNRSSGRLGVAVAEAAIRNDWTVTLLLGPTPVEPSAQAIAAGLDVHRFRTVADLETLLAEHLDAADVLVMAAAVADYRPVGGSDQGKLRRKGDGLRIELEATPDLLAACSERRRPGQLLVGFALEPKAELEASARRKLQRKGIDLVVANPLETMDAPTIHATVFGAPGTGFEQGRGPGRAISKTDFAEWLLQAVAECHNRTAV